MDELARDRAHPAIDIVTDGSAASRAHDERPDPRRWLALAVLSTAQLMVVLDGSIMNVALPSAQDALGMSVAGRHWAITAYVLAFGGLLLLGGRIADTVGRRRAFVIGLLGFAAASALAGSATDASWFFATRALQGAFAALVMPAALSLLTVTFTQPGERARAFSVYAAVSGAGAAFGVLLGGVLTEYASWRWCLLVNVPIAVLAAFAALALVRESRVQGARNDLWGAVLVTTGLVSLVYGLTEAGEPTRGWTSPITIGPLVVGLALLVLFVHHQSRTSHPLMPLRLLADRNRAGALISAVLVSAGLFAVLLVLAFYLQQQLGLGPLRAGLAFLPLSAAIVATSVLGSRVLLRLGAHRTLLLGAVLSSAGLGVLSLIDQDSTYASGVLPGEVLVGVGMGLVFLAQPTLVMDRVPAEDVGVSSALLNTSQQVGGAVGTALLNTVYATATAAAAATGAGVVLAPLSGYRWTFLAGAGLLLLAAVVIAVMVRDRGVEGPPRGALPVMH